MSAVDATLAERGSRYGEFDEHARITQGIKKAMASGRRWAALADDQKEALEMLAHKVGRILNGDPDYIDSWHDIIGYTRLVEQRLERTAIGDPTEATTFAPLKLEPDIVLSEIEKYLMSHSVWTMEQILAKRKRLAEEDQGA